MHCGCCPPVGLKWVGVLRIYELPAVSRSGAVGRFQRIQPPAKGIGPFQMPGFADLGRAVGVSAAARQQHTSIVKADVIHQSELVVGLGRLERPEKIVCF